MANENMIGSSAGETSAENIGVTSEHDPWHTAEDLAAATRPPAEEYSEKASAGLDQAKERVRTLREDGEDYVRENPMRAVLTALGVGFMLGVIFKR